ncbi:hypothetical protein PFTANZ_05964, partial [Plasmodium falciparum Tanzania (2000708)]
MNNTNITDCNDGCNKNCVCFDKWIKQKEQEWNSYFFQVMDKLKKEEAKWYELKDNIKEKIKSSKGKADGKNSEGAIKVLLDHLKETATICKDNNTNEGCDPSVDSKTNSCGKNTKAGSDKVISVKQIAQYYKRKAYAQLEESGSRRALKANASLGTYKRGGSGKDFKKLCSITDKDSNDSRSASNGGPCTGKDGSGVRMKIGTPWKGEGQAMQCPTTTKPPLYIMCRDTSITPLVDYIPQRLRWMTEWAEWYCKMQKEAYDELKKECGDCKVVDGKCVKVNGDCEKCKPACEEYKRKIKPWADQWKKMEEQYKKLYEHARVDIAANGGLNTSTAIKDNEDKSVIEFLFELYKENGGEIGNPSSIKPTNGVSTLGESAAPVDTTPTVYSTAAGYIHQEMGTHMQCKEQTKFCTGGDKYAFKEPPHGYDTACSCDKNERPVPVPEKKDDCSDIKTLLDESNGGKNRINGCNPKTGNFEWICGANQFRNNQEGPCMPPRRQKLCINDLKVLKDQSSTNTEDLREAFIKCAAKEIHFLWKKYKDDKKNENSNGGTPPVDTDNELKSGKIPDDFKRQMFYTLGDYRDLCLGNDLGNAHDTKNISVTVNGILKEEKNGNTPLTADDWWEKNAESIWQGMLCALSYDTNEKTFKQN